MSVVLPAPPVVGAPSPEPARITDAVRFRSEFGLEAGRSFVESTFSNPSFPDDDWGVPLSSAELGEMARRLRNREAIQPALEVAVKSPNYAGFYTDHHRGGISVFASTDPAGMAAALAVSLPAGVAVEFVQAERTEKQLDALQDQVHQTVDELRADGIEVLSIGLDTPPNSVAIGVHGLTDGETDALRARFGGGIYAYEQGPIENDGCTSMAWCWPMKGGLQMYQVGYSVHKCTTGFIVKTTQNPPVLAVVTAGHCLALHSGTEWGHALTPANAPNFGWEIGETWSTPPPGQTYARADVGLVKLRGTAVADLEGANYSHFADPSTNLAINAVRDHAFQAAGDPICRMGWGTWNASQANPKQGQTCGSVKRRDVSNWSCRTGLGPGPECRWILHTWEMTFDSLGGDSGGPVVQRNYQPPAFTYAYGTHVHSGSGAGAYGWYSPVLYGYNAYQLSKGYTYTVCTTYDC